MEERVLKGNEVVLFEDGTTQDRLEARWSHAVGAFYDVRRNEDGETYKIYSNTVIVNPKRKRTFKPTAKNCKVRLDVIGETEKCYIVADGSNGLVGRHARAYDRYVAKSICYVDERGNVFAPAWA